MKADFKDLHRQQRVLQKEQKALDEKVRALQREWFCFILLRCVCVRSKAWRCRARYDITFDGRAFPVLRACGA